MHFTSQNHLGDEVLEREFLLAGIPGILWTPRSPSEPVPLILMGHPGGPAGLPAMRSRLAQRARAAAADGFASVTIELPGSGSRPRMGGVEQARTELRRTVAAGESVPGELVDRLVLPMVEQAVPEWQATLEACRALGGIGGPVGYSGGVISLGVRLAAVEPRIVAAVLFAGSFVPSAVFDDARRVRIPLHVLLQWDDEGNDRRMALELFDALGSADKTLQANMGGHTGVPRFAGEEAGRFLARHLKNRRSGD